MDPSSLKISNRSNIANNSFQPSSSSSSDDEEMSWREKEDPQEKIAELNKLATCRKFEINQLSSATFSLHDILSLVYGSIKNGRAVCNTYETTCPEGERKKLDKSKSSPPFQVDGLYQKTADTQTFYEVETPDTKSALNAAAVMGILGGLAGFGLATLSEARPEFVSGIVTAGILSCAYIGWYVTSNHVHIKKKHKISTYKLADFPNDTFHLEPNEHITPKNTKLTKVFLMCQHADE